MITKIAISGYRSLRDVRIALAQLTVVTGPNGSGKSSLYRALKLLAEVAQGRKVIPTDDAYRPDGPPSAYRKPADPRAAGYDLDRQGRVVVPDGMVVTACAQAFLTIPGETDPASTVPP